MAKISSQDDTRITSESTGQGPALLLVHGGGSTLSVGGQFRHARSLPWTMLRLSPQIEPWNHFPHPHAHPRLIPDRADPLSWLQRGAGCHVRRPRGGGAHGCIRRTTIRLALILT
jgi:hypothetical protein